MRVLSRKPQAQTAAKKESGGTSGVENGIAGMSFGNGQRAKGESGGQGIEEEDSEAEEEKEKRRDALEAQERTRREREEKQRKYREVRERLFGSPGGGSNSGGGGGGNDGDINSAVSASNSGRNSPTKSNMHSTTAAGRGKPINTRNGRVKSSGSSFGSSQPQPLSSSSVEQSPARSSGGGGGGGVNGKQLFDPGYAAKPGSGYLQKSEKGQGVSSQVIRQPKGPDGSGRGGCGFTRGGRGAGVT